MEMKTSTEAISQVKTKLSVEIMADEVDKKINRSYQDLKKRAKIKGFRPGKVPKAILERSVLGALIRPSGLREILRLNPGTHVG